MVLPTILDIFKNISATQHQKFMVPVHTHSGWHFVYKKPDIRYQKFLLSGFAVLFFR